MPVQVTEDEFCRGLERLYLPKIRKILKQLQTEADEIIQRNT